jgi:amino acid permease
MTALLITSLDPAVSATASSAPITTFEAQQGNPIAEHRSGEQLLVEAYIFIWIIAIVFVGSMWMRQRAIGKRLNDLEAALDRAAAKAEESSSAEAQAQENGKD